MMVLIIERAKINENARECFKLCFDVLWALVQHKESRKKLLQSEQLLEEFSMLLYENRVQKLDYQSYTLIAQILLVGCSQIPGFSNVKSLHFCLLSNKISLFFGQNALKIFVKTFEKF